MEQPHGSDLGVARGIARWLDRLRIDPILGLFLPGAGDLLTGGVGLALVVIAVRARMPARVIARMLVNLAVDLLVGAIPLAGDAFDFWFQANTRNLALLERRAAAPTRGRAADLAYLVLAVVLFLAALALPVIVVIWALRRVF
jgi:hypothetical protein